MDPLQPADPRAIGTYQLVGRLGGGGMGQVFLGRSRGGRPVAVKVIRPELAADRDFRRRFADEVEAARKVGGFHTAQVVEADLAGDPPWLVTAYVQGPSLQQAVGMHGPLPPDSVRTLGAGLAEGLAAIHACGLVHRDLKPGNVILAEDGPRLIDFGIARALDGTSLTASGMLVGTPSFMSPEQALGHPIGPATDVFSLGAVLAFAATGQSPFGEGPAPAMVYRIAREDPDLRGVPTPLRPIVASCLAKEPSDRPSLTEIIDRLALPGAAEPSRAVSGLPAEGTGSGAPTPPAPHPTAQSSHVAPTVAYPGPAGQGPQPHETVTFRPYSPLGFLIFTIKCGVLLLVLIVLTLLAVAGSARVHDLLMEIGIGVPLTVVGGLLLFFENPILTLDAQGLRKGGQSGGQKWTWDQIATVGVRGRGKKTVVAVRFDPIHGPKRSAIPNALALHGYDIPIAVRLTGAERTRREQEVRRALAYFAGTRYNPDL
ncbi:MAG: hypothetical protein JWN52_2338 [Actinomycetia bacterium]|nr:hypothetical protein [Actinomycetes bacterium]